MFRRKGTKNLTSYRGSACVDCPLANIHKASHSGSLHAPAERPGKLHVDLLQLDLSIQGYRYAGIFIDEYTRHVWIRFLKHKSEIVQATELVIAEFRATVGTPLLPDQIELQKPRVLAIHSDHEGGYLSHYFTEFRANNSLHHTMSPPHDHDLNPIAERVIGNLSAIARAMKSNSNTPIGFWPYILANAAKWHNITSGSTGSSSASEQLSPHQNFTLTQPNGMDIPSFGCRTIVLKPTPHKVKTNLSPRGWLGCLLGMSQTSIGAYNVWIPELGKVVCSSSILCDEEYFPWCGKEAHKPLLASTAADAAPLPQPAFPSVGADPQEGITQGDTVASLNLPPNRKKLNFCSLFSGQYYRAGGLPKHLLDLGWDNVDQIDNSPNGGGGWAHDILNDEKYTQLKLDMAGGKYDVLFIAFPCTNFSMARFFSDPDKPGPPVLHCKDHPDGRPLDSIPGSHHKELRLTTKLLDRTCELARLARCSPNKTTIIWESPAKRSVKGTVQYCSDMPLHSTVFDTSPFTTLQEDTKSVSPWSSCTFAWCRMGGDAQKYTTLWFTADASALDRLNQPEHQCNHPEGTHARQAGGRLPDGSWASEDFVAFPQVLNAHIAIGATVARTGSAQLSIRVERPSLGSPEVVSPDPQEASPVAPALAPASETGAPGSPPYAESPAYRPFEPPLSPSPYVPPHRRDTPPKEEHPRQGRDARAVRSTTSGARSEATFQTAKATDLESALRREETRTAAAFGASLPRISEMATPESMRVNPDAMEEQVASVVSRVHNKSGGRRTRTQPIGEWLEVPASRVGYTPANHLPSKLRDLPQGTYVLELSSNEVKAVFGDSLTGDPLNTPHAHVSLLSTLQAVDDTPLNHKAARMGGKWTTAELKEIDNHVRNGSWERISASLVPSGRALHKLVWVFKVKRDGTCKARLCVQGYGSWQGF